jgi:hypothetical protein
MNMEFVEKCLDDSFYMKEKTAEWSSVLSSYIRTDIGRVVSCHVFSDENESCFIHIHVHYCREDITINVYALKKGRPTDMDVYAFDVLKVWKNALEDVDDLEGCAIKFAHNSELYQFDPTGEEVKKIVFVNGEMQTDL